MLFEENNDIDYVEDFVSILNSLGERLIEDITEIVQNYMYNSIEVIFSENGDGDIDDFDDDEDYDEEYFRYRIRDPSEYY
jgi:hypothetical protein